MMVALAIITVMLSAAAGALITFSLTTVNNERRLQATAFHSQLHEELQALPWNQAVLYATESEDLAEVGLDSTTAPATFEGSPVVTIPDPDNSACPVGEPECARGTFIPRAKETITVDGHDYDLFRAVTWMDDLGDGTVAKRFTTVVRWDVRGRTFEERFESTRAASVAELGAYELPEIVSRLVSPPHVLLDDADRNTQAITVTIEFNRGIYGAELRYEAVEQVEVPPDVEGEDPTYVDQPVERTLTLTPTRYDGAFPSQFAGTIPALDDRFATGEAEVVFVGTDGLEEVTASSTIHYYPAGTVIPPNITTVTLDRTTVYVGTNGADDGRLCQDLTIDAMIDDLATDGVVNAFYTAGTGTQQSSVMNPVGSLSGSSDLLRRRFAAGSVSLWEPLAPITTGPQAGRRDAVDVVTNFSVMAENPADPDPVGSPMVSTADVTFIAKTSNGGRC